LRGAYPFLEIESKPLIETRLANFREPQAAFGKRREAGPKANPDLLRKLPSACRPAVAAR
jgi:hypothetical protein